MRRVPALFLSLLCACAAATEDRARDGAIRPERVATSGAGMFTAAWRVVGADEVPENEPFELDVWLHHDPERTEPLTGAELVISAWMPDHGHGMNRRPEATEIEPGRYRVRGMLLHMGGFWQLFIDVIAGGVSERAQFELLLP